MNNPGKNIQAVAGLIQDMIASVRNRPFTPHSITKIRNLNYCRSATSSETIIEIGTFKGVTTKRLSRVFKRVISVEIDENLHQQALNYCKDIKNIELILGDGAAILPKIAKTVENAILFLDGHYSGGETSQGEQPEPVLLELDSILPYLNNFNAIVIDDFRLFGVETGWPKKHEIMQKLEANLKSSEWNHMILNDQFISTRKQTKR